MKLSTTESQLLNNIINLKLGYLELLPILNGRQEKVKNFSWFQPIRLTTTLSVSHLPSANSFPLVEPAGQTKGSRPPENWRRDRPQYSVEKLHRDQGTEVTGEFSLLACAPNWNRQASDLGACSSIAKAPENRNVYTPETSCMKGTSGHSQIVYFMKLNVSLLINIHFKLVVFLFMSKNSVSMAAEGKVALTFELNIKSNGEKRAQYC